MKRLLSLASLGVICVSLTACGGSSGDSNPAPTSNANNPGAANNSAASDLNPTALSLESPPTDGKLPIDLLPPA